MAKLKTADQGLLGLKFGEILVRQKKINTSELESALIAQKHAKVRIGEFLLQRNLITEDDLLRALSCQLGIETFGLCSQRSWISCGFLTYSPVKTQKARTR